MILTVEVQGLSTAGYVWSLEGGQLLDHKVMIEKSDQIGDSGLERFIISIEDSTNLSFQLRRPWEEIPIESYYFQIVKNRFLPQEEKK